MRGRLFWQLWYSYIGIVALSIIPFSWYLFFAIEANLRGSIATLLMAILIALVIASIASIVMAVRIIEPLERLRRGAERFAKGELSIRIYPSKTKEIAELANSLNTMAAQLQERLVTVARQQTEQDLILSSMIEGVITVNLNEQIVRINPAAIELLRLESSYFIGRSVQEVLHHAVLQRIVKEALADDKPKEALVSIPGEGEKWLEVYTRTLRDPSKEPEGVLLVFHEVTKLRRLETIRKDFVANVSHELRTPITNIKGFVETLLDGAMNSREDLQRFLEIIQKHAERLNSILNDLLLLARLEQDEDPEGIVLESTRIKDVFGAVKELCEPKARKKQIEIYIECSDDVTIDSSPSLLEQAMVNLVDNAINYSEAGDRITIKADKLMDRIILSVSDTGMGIDKNHLARLFERFYRVDQARSRKQGGTGLGLSIVKHISYLHGGYPTVSSTLGEGSTFSLHIPIDFALSRKRLEPESDSV